MEIKDIVPERPLRLLLDTLVKGLEKHGTWNSSKPSKDYRGAIDRHLLAYDKGKFFDEGDIGQHHLVAVIISCMVLISREILKNRRWVLMG